MSEKQHSVNSSMVGSEGSASVTGLLSSISWQSLVVAVVITLGILMLIGRR